MIRVKPIRWTALRPAVRGKDCEIVVPTRLFCIHAKNEADRAAMSCMIACGTF